MKSYNQRSYGIKFKEAILELFESQKDKRKRKQKTHLKK